MLKRLMVVLAALAAAFTLAAGPASASHGNLQMWDGISQSGSQATVVNADVQTLHNNVNNCTNITDLTATQNPNDIGEVRSVLNNSSFSIQFFTGSGCTGSSTTVAADSSDANLYATLGNFSARSIHVS